MKREEIEDNVNRNNRNRWRFRWMTVKFIAFTIAVLAIISGLEVLGERANTFVMESVSDIKQHLADRFDLVRYETKIVRLENVAVEKLVEAASRKSGIDPILVHAIMDKESNSNPYSFRYESVWERDYATKYTRAVAQKLEGRSLNDEEYKLYFSSIGLMQISYPIWKDFCGVNVPSDLFDPETNINCAIRIVSECIKNSKVADPYQKVRTCFRQYNGSGPKAEAYADDMIRRVASQAIRNFGILKTVQANYESEEIPVGNKSGGLVPANYREVGELPGLDIWDDESGKLQVKLGQSKPPAKPVAVARNTVPVKRKYRN